MGLVTARADRRSPRSPAGCRPGRSRSARDSGGWHRDDDHERAATAAGSDRPSPPDLQLRATLLAFVLCLFLPAGTWAWPRGWLFFSVVIAASIVITLYLRRANPDVIAARVNRHEGTKGWDRWVLGLLIPAMVSILPVAALDDGRYHWPVPWWACGIGYVLLIAGLAGLTWASGQQFFEPTVRIQADRGHTVVDTGPYAIVRHPGYVAAGLLVLGMPLALGSYWAMIPARCACLPWSCGRPGRTEPSRRTCPATRITPGRSGTGLSLAYGSGVRGRANGGSPSQASDRRRRSRRAAGISRMPAEAIPTTPRVTGAPPGWPQPLLVHS